MKFQSARYLLKTKQLPESKPELATTTPSGDVLTLSPEEVTPRKKIFEIVSFPYKVIQIIPDGRLGNRSYEEVVNAIYSLYKELGQRITVQQGIKVTKTQPIYFEILYDTEITFNFVIKEDDSIFLKNKLSSIFPTSTVMFREFDYIGDFEGSYTYGYNYEKHYLCSMNTSSDKSPLNSLLAIKKDIGEEEKALFSMSVVPLNRQVRSDMHDLWDSIKKGKNIISRQSVFSKIMEGFFDFVDQSLNFLDEIVEIHPDVVQEKDKTQSRVKALVSELRSETRQKPNYDQFKCNFKTYVQTKDRNTAFAVAKGVETALKDMSGDNELIMDSQHAKFEAKKDKPIQRQYNLLKPNNNILSTLELANIIRLPEAGISKRYKMPTTKTKLIKTPKEMEKGMIKLCQIYKEGKPVQRYFPQDRDIMCLPLFLITKMGGGKTTFLLNFANDCISAGHGLVMFDYIRDCGLAKALIALHPECLVIKFEEIEDLVTFGFPEIQITDTDSPYQRKLKANMLGDEVRYLLNSMAKDTDPLSRIMSQYLKSACKLVFIHNKKTLKDVYEVLIDEDTRENYIEMGIDQNVFSNSDFEVRNLRELSTDSGNKRIQGLLDRFSIITDDTLFQEMFNKPYEANINFVDIMDNSKPVVFLMPQHVFTNKLSKDVICTYFMSRIRLAMSRRKDFDKIAHVIIDELHQIPQAVELISETIAEPRKFALQYALTLHSFSQIKSKELREKILDVGCNFMLLKGCSKSAYDELQPIIGEDFEFEDIGNMDYNFGALNLFSIKNSYHPFIGELPPALKDEKGNLYIN